MGTALSEVLHSVRLGGQQVFGWVFLLFGFFFSIGGLSLT